MVKKVLHILLFMSLVLPFLAGTLAFSMDAESHSPLHPSAATWFKNPYQKNPCKPLLPKCPLCYPSGQAITYPQREAVDDLPPLALSFMVMDVARLADQGFVKAIFHPPLFLL